MLHPVGSHAPGVYWRRRAALFGALAVLILLTAWVLRPGGGDGKPVAATPSSSESVPVPSSSADGPSTAGSTSGPRSAAGSGSGSGAGAAGSSGIRHGSAHATPSKPPQPCVASALTIAAVTGAPTYSVGAQPVVMLQVTNSGTSPCVQDLADAQIELRVYNGESRVWDSHDCQVQPGTDPRTLAGGQTVRVSVIWSGLSSQPGCTGTRQRVGAGQYTLYARLAGHDGSAAQFSIV